MTCEVFKAVAEKPFAATTIEERREWVEHYDHCHECMAFAKARDEAVRTFLEIW